MKYVRYSIVFALLVITGCDTAAAAEASFTPSRNEVAVGEQVVVALTVSSDERAIDTLTGTLVYPADFLTLKDVLIDDTIVDVWFVDPLSSTRPGYLSYEGIAIDGGFTGTSGTVMTLVFEATTPGAGTISLSSGSLLSYEDSNDNLLGLLPVAQVRVGNDSLLQPVVALESTPEIVTREEAGLFIRAVPFADNTDTIRSYQFWHAPADLPVTHYEVSLDGLATTSVSSPEHTLRVPGPAEYELAVAAVTDEGVVATSSVRFTVEALPVPELRTYPKQLIFTEPSWFGCWGDI